MFLWDQWKRWRAARNQQKAAARAAAFWQWFASISDDLLERVRGGGPGLEQWLEELNRRTAGYHPAVRAVLGLVAGAPELVLTAEGNPSGAEHVRSLVAARPPLRDWTIRAFKPAVSVSDCVVQVGAITLTPDDVEFTVINLQHPDVGEEIWLRWSEQVVMEDRAKPAPAVALLERHSLNQLPAFPS